MDMAIRDIVVEVSRIQEIEKNEYAVLGRGRGGRGRGRFRQRRGGENKENQAQENDEEKKVDGRILQTSIHFSNVSFFSIEPKSTGDNSQSKPPISEQVNQ